MHVFWTIQNETDLYCNGFGTYLCKLISANVLTIKHFIYFEPVNTCSQKITVSGSTQYWFHSHFFKYVL